MPDTVTTIRLLETNLDLEKQVQRVLFNKMKSCGLETVLCDFLNRKKWGPNADFSDPFANAPSPPPSSPIPSLETSSTTTWSEPTPPSTPEPSHRRQHTYRCHYCRRRVQMFSHCPCVANKKCWDCKEKGHLRAHCPWSKRPRRLSRL